MQLLKKNTVWISIVGAVLLLAAMLFVQFQTSLAGYIRADQPAAQDRFARYEFFASSTPNATPTLFSTTTTSTSTNITSWTDGNGRVDNGYMVVAGAKAVTLWFSRAVTTDNTVGSTTFRIEVSRDGTNWNRYYKLISNATNSNSQTLTRVETVMIALATSTTVATMDNDAFYAIRCIAVEATTGEHSCTGTAQF